MSLTLRLEVNAAKGEPLHDLDLGDETAPVAVPLCSLGGAPASMRPPDELHLSELARARVQYKPAEPSAMVAACASGRGFARETPCEAARALP